MITHMRRRKLFGLPLTLLLLAAPGAQSASPPQYQIVEIAASANEMVDGLSLNDSNEALVSIGNGPLGQRFFCIRMARSKT